MRSLFSWFPIDTRNNQFYKLLVTVTEPLLEPVRQELAKLNTEREELTGPGRINKYNNKPGRIPRTLIAVSGMPRAQAGCDGQRESTANAIGPDAGPLAGHWKARPNSSPLPSARV